MVSLHERVGGEAFFVALVDRFYAGVAEDELLRPLYPEADLAGARARLTGFLVQYWGGPTTYSDERGHPRLRMRHAPFPVDVAARDRWLGHMREAVGATATDPEVANELLAYFEQAADAMRNTPG
ncbi:MAG TPA: globin [Acidimicrobiales bacterium]|jgi:hemoglobin